MPAIDPPASISLNQTLVLTAPAKSTGHIIDKADWDYLKLKVSKMQMPCALYQNLGSAALGVTGSAFVAALTFPHGVTVGDLPAYIISWCITVVSLIAGTLALVFHGQQKHVLSCSKDDVLAEITRMEARFRPNSPSSEGPANEASKGTLAGLIQEYLDSGCSPHEVFHACVRRGYPELEVAKRLLAMGLLSKQQFLAAVRSNSSKCFGPPR